MSAGDRELLALAAQAAGVCLHPEDKLHRSYGNWGCDTTCTVCKKDPCDASWDPIANDRDAFRLAIDLSIQFGVVNEDSRGWAESHAAYIDFEWDMHRPSDRYAATRRAIVQAVVATQQPKESTP